MSLQRSELLTGTKGLPPHCCSFFCFKVCVLGKPIPAWSKHAQAHARICMRALSPHTHTHTHTHTRAHGHAHAHAQVMVPRTFAEFTSRRVLTTGWLEGEKLSQSKADDVGSLVNVGVISYLKQLLDTGMFHADPRE